MASTSGIRANGSGEYVKKIILKDVESYGPWKTKVIAILDAEDCWEIVNGTKTEPGQIASIADAANALVLANQVAVDSRRSEIKYFRKRYKKAASLITQTVDDNIVMSLDVHQRNRVEMWNPLAADFNTITQAQLRAPKKEFDSLAFNGTETYLEMKQTFHELVRRVNVQEGVISTEERLSALLNALPQKYDLLLESYNSARPAPGIDYVGALIFPFLFDFS